MFKRLKLVFFQIFPATLFVFLFLSGFAFLKIIFKEPRINFDISKCPPFLLKTKNGTYLNCINERKTINSYLKNISAEKLNLLDFDKQKEPKKGTICKIYKGNFHDNLLCTQMSGYHKIKFKIRININNANRYELSAIPGIGLKKADAIVKFRNLTAGFKTIRDLEKVPGIGKKTVEKIKKFITY